MDKATTASVGDRGPLPGRRAWQSVAAAGSSLPNLVWAALFFAVPVAIMLVYSFAQQDSLTAKISFGWTLENYRDVTDPVVLRALVRSLWISGLATLACLLLGYPVAYFLAFHAGRLKFFFLACVIIPFLTSFVVRTYAWIGILGPKGTVNDLLIKVGIVDQPLHLLFNSTGIIVGITYNYLPLMVLSLFVVLDRIDPKVLESARDLGAGGISAFFRVIFPQALPGMIAGIIAVGAPAAGEYVIPTILGGGKTLMFGNVIAAQFGSSFAWPYCAALSVVLTGLLLILITGCVRVTGRDRMQQVQL
jgi:ABC-type spermidine/putrescine transport system permease subunit I